ncbi:peptidoglycan D,D-transpeptidase FtsI family protein [Kordiimonas pumila]|uniref:Peptidoglycan D,D-transpeptidase FtsI family protein n=1 Tax=Kordiimonas pumila TaxID=2161677 RepID=A0ABV7D756_9PROT|nr:penicillin-binding protein 2 [Kordiimonas pumila]
MTDFAQSYSFIETNKPSRISTARARLMIAVLLFFAAFLVMIARTIELGFSAPQPRVVTSGLRAVVPPVEVARADIVDRNGDILATNLETSSLYADATAIKNPTMAAQKLVSILPDLSFAEVEAKLSSGKRFIWLKRKLTPRQKWQVNALGIPAFQFQREEERLYPQGRLAAHVLGYVDVDGNGLGGVEHFFDASLVSKNKTGEPLKLSLDMRVQYALADELESAMNAYQAIGAAGLVMNVNSGEVLGMVSLPNYDPNNLRGVADEALFNRVTQGVYELGSTFKTFTFAAALDNGIVDMTDGYDASKPLRVARFTIKDDHPKNRYLTLPEIFTYSSNIGTAQMALDLGADKQQAFLSSLGMMQPANIELTEVGAPLYPTTWRKSSIMTISYGHGIAVSPLQLASGIAAMVNGGRLHPATLVHNPDAWQNGKQVISPATSRQIRQLLRLAVRKGTGKRGEAIGYRVGGKTGTAEKAVAGGYKRKSLISSFVGVYPMDDPQYVVFALLDEPKGTKETYGFASGGWVAAPVVRNVILRTAPLLGVAPENEDEGLYQKLALMIEK